MFMSRGVQQIWAHLELKRKTWVMDIGEEVEEMKSILLPSTVAQ